MTHIEIGKLLTQIDKDYNESIYTVRQIMTSGYYTSTDKKVIAMKIIHLVDQMKLEVLPWTK